MDSIDDIQEDTEQNNVAAAIALLPEEPALHAASNTPVVDNKPVEPTISAPTPNPAEEAVKARIAELVAKEQEVLQARQASKAEVEAANRALAELQRRFDEREAELRDAPMKALERYKWDLESLINHTARQSTPAEVEAKRIRDEVASLRQDLTKRDEAAAQAAQQAAAQRAMATLKEAIIPAKLEVIKDELPYLHAWHKSPGAVIDAVYTLMGQTFDSSKGATVLEPQAAARQLEKELRDRVQALPGAKVTPPTTSTPQPKQPVAVKPSKTLTNHQTQAHPVVQDTDPFDRAARAAKALAVLDELQTQ